MRRLRLDAGEAGKLSGLGAVGQALVRAEDANCVVGGAAEDLDEDAAVPAGK